MACPIIGGHNKAHFAALCTPITPRQRRNGPFCCCMTLFAANALQWIVNGKERPSKLPIPRATAKGNMYKKFGKDHACDSIDILSNRQTDRCTDRQTLPITTRVPCSNAAKMQNPLKFAGVPQTRRQISAASMLKFTIL